MNDLVENDGIGYKPLSKDFREHFYIILNKLKNKENFGYCKKMSKVID